MHKKIVSRKPNLKKCEVLVRGPDGKHAKYKMCALLKWHNNEENKSDRRIVCKFGEKIITAKFSYSTWVEC